MSEHLGSGVGTSAPAAPLILFVCTANICRSAWAEARAQQLLPGYRIASAGTHALRGRGIDPTMAQTLPAGAEKTTAAQQLTRELVADAALILTMEAAHRGFLIEEFPAAIRRTFTLGQFAETIRTAPAGLPLDELVRWAYLNRVPSRRDSDIADPYGRGLAAAGKTAVELEGLLGEVAAKLGRPS